ncbi:MAG: flagellar transcriptional regulator FlhD [Leclercia adecarboxylata]|nr:flagellar transcriptional regulator FlhD [Leclercia adecarboxylata]
MRSTAQEYSVIREGINEHIRIVGIHEEMATTLGGLTLPQMVKLAETNQLVCQFRFDNHQTVTQLTQESRVDDLQQVHTGILLSTRLLNEISQPDDAARKKRA